MIKKTYQTKKYQSSGNPMFVFIQQNVGKHLLQSLIRNEDRG